MATAPGLLADAEQKNPGAHQGNAGPVPGARAFAEEYRGEDGHQDNAELVDGGDLGGVADLEGAKVAEP